MTLTHKASAPAHPPVPSSCGAPPPFDRNDRGPPKDMGAWLGWTEARILELRRLREVLGLSLGQVVKVWAGEGGGPSRNAVIGACYRNGIGGAPHVQLKSIKPRARKPWRLESAAQPPEPKLREKALPTLRTVEVQCPPKLLTDLERGDCHYPVAGQGDETLFCAAPRN